MAALVRAVKAGKLTGAGLDVLPHERLLRDEAETFLSDRHTESEVRSLLASNVLLEFPNWPSRPVMRKTRRMVHRIVETTPSSNMALAREMPQNGVS